MIKERYQSTHTKEQLFYTVKGTETCVPGKSSALLRRESCQTDKGDMNQPMAIGADGRLCMAPAQETAFDRFMRNGIVQNLAFIGIGLLVIFGDNFKNANNATVDTQTNSKVQAAKVQSMSSSTGSVPYQK